MPRIVGFHVQNFRILRDVPIGSMASAGKPLTGLAALIGKNGTGKSTLFDAFGFLRDMLVIGVEEACDARQRGGLERLFSTGTEGPITIAVHYIEVPGESAIGYGVRIASDTRRRPVVLEESLIDFGTGNGDRRTFLRIQAGEGQARHDETGASVPVKLTDNRHLAISTLGGLKDHPRIGNASLIPRQSRGLYKM